MMDLERFLMCVCQVYIIGRALPSARSLSLDFCIIEQQQAEPPLARTLLPPAIGRCRRAREHVRLFSQPDFPLHGTLSNGLPG